MLNACRGSLRFFLLVLVLSLCMPQTVAVIGGGGVGVGVSGGFGGLNGSSLRAFLLSLLVPFVSPFNWAQVSGWNRQNTAWSSRPPQNLTRRHSFAAIVMQQHVVLDNGVFAGGGALARGQSPSPSPKPVLSGPSKLFIMGGDDFTRDKRGNPNFGIDIDGHPLDTNFPKDDIRSPVSGMGGLRNDIFWTGGAVYKKHVDYRLRSKITGDPTPSFISSMNWTEIPPWKGMGDYASWKDYLGCTHESHPFPCTDVNRVMADGSDPSLTTRRWSPRRGAASCSLPSVDERPNLLFIIGGRARSFENVLSASDARGGLQTAFGSGIQARADDLLLLARERTVLTNDVWMSKDEGRTWDFTNAGCWGRNVPGGETPMNSAKEMERYQKSPGTALQRCTSDEDCFNQYFGKASICRPLNQQNPSERICICGHFSPRENAAIAATDAFQGMLIFITGGIGEIQLNRCGAVSCGRDQSVMFRDLWRSSDFGVSWEEMTGNALVEEYSGRSNHRLEYGNKQLYILAGRGVSTGNPAVDELFNKVAISNSGTEWEYSLISTPFSPRRDHMSCSDGSSIYIFGGLVEQAHNKALDKPILTPTQVVNAEAAKNTFDVLIADDDAIALANDPPPRLNGVLDNGLQVAAVGDFYAIHLTDFAARTQTVPVTRSKWYRDFSNESSAPLQRYLYLSWPLSRILPELNTTVEERAALAYFAGASSILHLSKLTRSQIETLIGWHPERFVGTGVAPVTRVCELKRRAQALVSLCAVAFRPWDSWAGEELTPRINDEGLPDAIPPPLNDLCLNEPPIVTTRWDFICQQTPPPRAKGALLIMDARLYVFGGWEDDSFLSNDLWVRDDVLPRVNITVRPADMGDRTILDASCNKIDCIFEARFWDITDEAKPILLRPWALIPLPYDTLTVNGDMRRTRVELRGVDPAGNRDIAVVPGASSYEWTHRPLFPTIAATISILLVMLLLLLSYLFWRRHKRQKALDALAKRRLERRMRAKKRHRRTQKKVQRMKRQKTIVSKRPKADNLFSENDAYLRNQFKAVLRNRSDRSREQRNKGVHDALAPTPLTKSAPSPPKWEPPPENIAASRGGKSALDFDTTKLALAAKLDVKMAHLQFAAETELARRVNVGANTGKRLDMAADTFRGALHVQSEMYRAATAASIVPSRIPQNLAEKAARNEARRKGLNPDSAWTGSSMKASVSPERERAKFTKFAER